LPLSMAPLAPLLVFQLLSQRQKRT
jgi:hypothetical protein